MLWRRIASDVKIDGAMSPTSTPSSDFPMQMRGTLSESLSAAELPKLNRALRLLFGDLRHASQLFRECGDGGREGAVVALGAVWRFVVLFDRPFSESLHVPLLRLQDALMALENNQVDPVVRAVRRRGRSASSVRQVALRANAAGAVRRLCEAGVERANAYRQVAKLLNELGVKAERGSKDLSATTIRHWCNKVAEDVSRSGDAARVYDSMFSPDEIDRFARLSNNQAQKHALDSLAGFVETIFPELARPSGAQYK
jgi:hypothetical protein